MEGMMDSSKCFNTHNNKPASAYIGVSMHDTPNANALTTISRRAVVWEIEMARGQIANFSKLLSAHSIILSLLVTVNLIGFLQPPKGWVVTDVPSHVHGEPAFIGCLLVFCFLVLVLVKHHHEIKFDARFDVFWKEIAGIDNMPELRPVKSTRSRPFDQ